MIPDDARGDSAQGARSSRTVTDDPRYAAKRLLDEVRGAIDFFPFKQAILHGASALLPAFTFTVGRAQLLRWRGVDIGEQCAIMGHVRLFGPAHAPSLLHIGSGCVLGPDVVFGLDAPITIGNNVAIGPGAMIHSGTHPLGPGSRRMAFRRVAKPITIEDGAWVGMRAMVLPGVRIGRGAVVGAGAVVTSDVEANTLVNGNPAAFVKKLPLGDR